MAKCLDIKLNVPQYLKQIKTILEKFSYYHGILKSNGEFTILTNIGIPESDCSDGDFKSYLRKILGEKDSDMLWFDEIEVGVYEKTVPVDTESIDGCLKNYLDRNQIQVDEIQLEALLSKLPRKWSIYPPMALLNSNTFDSEIWSTFFRDIINKDAFFESLITTFKPFNKLTHIAINKPIIEQDIMRRPFNLVPLYGDFGPEPTDQMFDAPTEEDFQSAFWCHVVQNGIYQTWAPRYTMFSRGNIKEKKRVLETFTNIANNSVIDLYAGIGYFTLSYLKRGGRLFCWEINPWSIRGLTQGLEKNGFKYKLIFEDEQLHGDDLQQGKYDAIVFQESNELAVARFESMFRQFHISHINLGLLPSSQPSWPITVELIKRFNNHEANTRTMVHIHENVHVNDFGEFTEQTRLRLQQYLDQSPVPDKSLTCNFQHLEKIKTFAPDVMHVCCDYLIGIAR